MSIFFTADPHFGHENIIKYCSRPYKNVTEMDEALVKNWNDRVKPSDTVYLVGDAFFKAGHRHLWRLQGTIHLILGNHDNLDNMKQLNVARRFATIKDFSEIEVHGEKIVLFHYGMRTWRRDLRGSWHLYGHSHGKLKPYGKSCDVGVDSWNYSPVPFEDLKMWMDMRKIGDHPMFDTYTEEPCPDCQKNKKDCTCGFGG